MYFITTKNIKQKYINYIFHLAGKPTCGLVTRATILNIKCLKKIVFSFDEIDDKFNRILNYKQ